MKKITKKKILIIACVIGALLLIYVRLLSHPIRKRVGDFTVDFYSNRVCLAKYHGTEECVTIPNKIGIMPVRTIGFCCFMKNSVIKSVTIPENVEILEPRAFAMCDNLESVKAEEIKFVGYDTFLGDNRLKEANLGNRLETISSNAFQGCEALSSIPYSSKLKSLGHRAFWGSGIEEIGDLSGVNVEEAYIFEDTPWMDKQDTDYVIINNVLQKYKGDKNVSVIPYGVEVLSEAYGWESEEVLTIYLPESVKKICAIGLFVNPNYVIYIPESVEYIEKNEVADENRCKIITVSGSYAEQYAIDNDINYEIVDGWEVPEEDSAE
ncbi:Leucine rich repeat-containing protein [Lachnospiraceae bacterium XPB1003]|nr:Leucine rich repeat-containing protein [Lachnospiraceae bacterium XPB1003]